MFNYLSIFVIVVATSIITYQTTKHGWASFIDHDEVNPEQAPQPKHQAKHVKRVYDWEHDNDFKKSLHERKSA